MAILPSYRELHLNKNSNGYRPAGRDRVGLAADLRLLDVAAAGAVALLALDRLEVGVLDDLGAAGLAEAGDVAADAAQVVLFVVVVERLEGSGVSSVAPESHRLVVA